MRNREDLEKSWEITASFLGEARSLLCECTGVGKYIAESDEYLDYNELEIALDMLEEAALHAEGPMIKAIWERLWQAAKSMGLEDRYAFYEQKVGNS